MSLGSVALCCIKDEIVHAAICGFFLKLSSVTSVCGSTPDVEENKERMIITAQIYSFHLDHINFICSVNQTNVCSNYFRKVLVFS